MRHDWKTLTATSETVVKHGWLPRRECTNCGTIQQRETVTNWGRIISYLWRPLAGRCGKTQGGI